MRFYKKFSLLFGVLVFLSMVLLNSSMHAATIVGQRLDEPEPGWQRYDDTSEFLYYSGSWTKARPSAKGNHYNDNYSYTTDTKNGKLTFAFYGTKMRYIGQTYSNKAKVVRIKIDGAEETFRQQGADTYLIVNYEKLDLPLGYHTVEVTFDDSMLMVDAIDIDDDGRLVGINTPINLEATGGDSKVLLKWDAVTNAEEYTIRYGTEPGKYNETVKATKDEYGNFVIPGLTNGTTYYFVVSAIVDGVESQYSNEASATPQGPVVVEPEEPSGNRAILVVTMTTGLEKEFDLSMQEVNSFIDWYETKQAGSGRASYAIDKHDNNKGPFKNRKDYILFDRVLTFEVSEY